MDFCVLLRSLVFFLPTQSTLRGGGVGGTKDQRSNPQQASWLDTRHFFFLTFSPIWGCFSLFWKGHTVHCPMREAMPTQVTSICLNPQGGPCLPHTGVFAFAKALGGANGNRIFFPCMVAELWARINTGWWNPPGSALLEKGKVALRSPHTMLGPDKRNGSVCH